MLKERDAGLREQHKGSAGIGLPGSREEAINLAEISNKDPLAPLPPALPTWPHLLSSPPAQRGDPVLALTDSLLRDITDARPSSRYAVKLYLESGQVCRLPPPLTHWVTAGKSLRAPESSFLHL